jgi:hypothetical protein
VNPFSARLPAAANSVQQRPVRQYPYPVIEYGDSDVLFFVRTWAEAVIRQLDRVRAIQVNWVTDVRAAERMDGEWGPSEDTLERNFRVRWAEEHTLIWAAHQLEKWSRRLAAERGDDPPQPDKVLAKVRNALEHLDEADFEKGQAVPGPLGSNRSLRALPGGRLWISLGNSLLGGLIGIEELEWRALSMVRRIEFELDLELRAQLDSYVQIMDE